MTIRIEGRERIDRTYLVGACSSRVVGVHEIVPGDANFGASVFSAYPSSGTLIMRSMLPNQFWLPSMTLVPPIDRVR